jgi:hypothetical protein
MRPLLSRAAALIGAVDRQPEALQGGWTTCLRMYDRVSHPLRQGGSPAMAWLALAGSCNDNR